jgi:phosphomevalonate kinase
MLSGEYSVLYGGAAVLIPVPRYLVLTRSETPPDEPYRKMISEAREYPIPELDTHESVHGVPHMSVDYSQFYIVDETGTSLKLGLGSSSAEAVGAIALRYECAGISWQDRLTDVAQHAFRAHKQAQGGKGSGADVVACSYQVPIRYRMQGNSFDVVPVKRSERLGQIPLALVYSGVPADTRILMGRFESWINHGGSEVEVHLKKLISASEVVANAWFWSPPEKLFEAVDAFNETLRVCAEDAPLPYILPVHEKLEAWALQHGGRAKPTGAGGGDLILLMGDLPYDQLDMPLIPLSSPLSP